MNPALRTDRRDGGVPRGGAELSVRGDAESCYKYRISGSPALIAGMKNFVGITYAAG